MSGDNAMTWQQIGYRSRANTCCPWMHQFWYVVERVSVLRKIDQAEPNSNADQLYQRMDELSAKLGPEYIALIGELQEMDPDSEDGREIASTLGALDKLCAK